MDIKITLSDLEYQILSHDLVDPSEWANLAVSQKIAKCKERLLREATDVLLNDENVTSLPATADEIIQTYLDREDYQNRIERESQSDPSV
jgi:hypothetical protein